MFIRKRKRYSTIGSLEQVIAVAKDGSNLRLEDTLMDEDSDFVNGIVQGELLLEVRRQVDMIEKERDREIVKLYFGFYEDKSYSQREIEEMMGISCSYISIIISRVLKRIRKNLEEQYSSGKVGDVRVLNLKDEKGLGNGANYESSGQVASGSSLSSIVESEIKKEVEIYEKEEVLESSSSDNEVILEEEENILKMFRSPIFKRMIGDLSFEEAVVVSLKLGYVGGKCFTTESIAKFLEIDEDEIREITKRGLLFFKRTMNQLIDDVVCRDEINQSKGLSLKLRDFKK